MDESFIYLYKDYDPEQDLDPIDFCSDIDP